MSEFWNFTGTTFVATSNWPWLAAALVLGLIVGWWSYTTQPDG